MEKSKVLRPNNDDFLNSVSLFARNIRKKTLSVSARESETSASKIQLNNARFS